MANGWVHAHPPPTRRGNACHAVPYGTDSLGNTFPGTSCQATIVRSLRDAAPGLKMSKLHGRCLQRLPPTGRNVSPLIQNLFAPRCTSVVPSLVCPPILH